MINEDQCTYLVFQQDLHMSPETPTHQLRLWCVCYNLDESGQTTVCTGLLVSCLAAHKHSIYYGFF